MHFSSLKNVMVNRLQGPEVIEQILTEYTVTTTGNSMKQGMASNPIYKLTSGRPSMISTRPLTYTDVMTF